MTLDPEEEPAPEAWTLVQIGELLRVADELLIDCQRLLGPHAHGGFAEDAVLTLDLEAVEGLHALVGDLADASDRLRVLGDCLPAAELELRYEDLRDAAAEDLAGGVAEPGRALLAARTLDLASGWPALAEALRGSELHADWHEVGVAQLLRRFRGADGQLVRRVLADAEIEPGVTFSTCPPERLAALADALEARAGRR